MKILIQKFGGTSVSTPERRSIVIDKVAAAKKKGYNPVVVVSAMGRKNDPYSTDTLLSLAGGAHTSLNKRNLDLIMCCGELISTVVIAQDFCSRGYKAMALTGGNAGIITDDAYGSAEIVKVESEKLTRLLSNGIIPVVAGFQGVTANGDLTTIGRGGSDVTAAVLGSALKAECVEIYTDVDGVMTADPRVVPDARLIDQISYDAAFQLADEGAKVVHPRAVEYAMISGVPLVVKNTLSDSAGTIVSSESLIQARPLTAITSLKDRVQFVISTENWSFEKDALTLLSENNISIDLINIFPDKDIFTVDGKDSDKVEEVLRSVSAEYKLLKGCSKVSIHDTSMRGVPGFMAKILKALSSGGIKVLQTADSHSTIWCLVSQMDSDKAVQLLHKAFVK
jgi:aspartate kinase